MIHQWCERLRTRWLRYLRPGRDEAELLALLARAEAVQSEEHRRMLERLTMFHDVRARELMVPRSEIFALEISLPLKKAGHDIAERDYSKLPVYKDDLDQIEGIVHAWDVFSSEIHHEQKTLSQLIRPCLHVPESQLVMGLLVQMKREGMHMAMVIDEYGSTAGLVTLSDLLAEIVGPMDEAGDAEDGEECVPHPNGGYIVAGGMRVEDLEEEMGLTLPEGDYETVAGLLTSQCGRIPLRDEHFNIPSLSVHILEAEPRRILKIHLKQSSAGNPS